MFINNIFNKNNFKIKFNFRFAPEPNGYLHLGHLKSLYLNYFLSQKYNKNLILRFDDTNPKKSKKKYVKQIIKDIKWLNIKINKITYASNYFNKLYKFAIILIKNKLAYIDFQSFKQINKNKYKKNINIKYRNISIKKNLYYFKKMKLGKYKEKKCVLRAKINNFKKKNIFLQDPIMYRIINKKHFRTKYKWNIYPTYDWAHGQCDLIENIKYSLCSQEFEHHKLLYNWFKEKINKYYYNNNKKIIPKQIEYSRLNINYNILSKRKINFLIKKKIINKWYDCRLLTIKSLKNKGYYSNILLKFIKQLGYSKRPVNLNNLSLLNNIFINNIDYKSYICMVVHKPIKIKLLNNKKLNYILYNIKRLNNKIKYIKIFYKNILYISKYDFNIIKNKEKKQFNFLSNVRLKNLGIINLKYIKYNFLKNKIINLYCLIKKNNNIKKKYLTIQWISNINKHKLIVYYYNKLFLKKNIEKLSYKNILFYYNKKSLLKLKGYTNLNFINNKNKIFQFQRLGYYYLYKKYIKYNKCIYIFNNIFLFKYNALNI
ncbi:MAG: glutamate--tRNA ligase family protein [Candidatus Shikimatogenerans sp. AspAUS03]|uniref:50S ribosomal protein L25 n=1 Tax=Candidatus Shikimatogenerans sp. AspAUS03 TaxID=3158563 RepID=A0AAU7QUZ4_9FLAO